MELSSAITLQISRVKPGNPRSEGGTDGREGGGREGRMGGREGWMDVMAIMKWVHMAWNRCIIGNPSEAG